MKSNISGNFYKKFAFHFKIWYTYTSQTKNGAVAQLGARLNGIQKVVGSIPISSIFLFSPIFC